MRVQYKSAAAIPSAHIILSLLFNEFHTDFSMSSTACSSTSFLIVVRHGERIDYATRDQGGNWLTDQERPFDPPLTDHGIEQASKLGKDLLAKTETLNMPSICGIYTSPFVRCRQTASAMRRAMTVNNNHDDQDEIKDENGNNSNTPLMPLVRVEPGLAESINESWYRSWSLPGANGTWGFGGKKIDDKGLHPLARKPIQNVLRLLVTDNNCSLEKAHIDANYEPLTSIVNPYSFFPKYLESKQDQRDRMRQAVSALLQPNQTTIVVSHGGPVTHLYEDISGNDWKTHGECSYCCYSVYKSSCRKVFETVVVNESSFLEGERIVTERHV